MTTLTDSQPLTTLIDSTTSSTYTYIGEAIPGSSVSEDVWRISRITNSSGSCFYANRGLAKSIWDNRVDLSYA